MVVDLTKQEQEKPESEPKEEPDKIDEANKAAERLEKANKQMAELIAKQEKLLSKDILSGRSMAGQKEPEKKSISNKEYAKMIMEGKANPMKDEGIF